MLLLVLIFVVLTVLATAQKKPSSRHLLFYFAWSALVGVLYLLPMVAMSFKMSESARTVVFVCAMGYYMVLLTAHLHYWEQRERVLESFKKYFFRNK